PLRGGVPALTPAADAPGKNHLGLLASPATVASPYTHTLKKEHASNVTVSLYSSVERVAMEEQLYFTQQLDTLKLHKELTRLRINSDIDVLVLVCTH
ncbi:glutamate racemase, partial [Pseudoalteromonas sp. S1691]